MAAETIKEFYVYALLHDDRTPFYIGKGKGDRWLVHERRVLARGRLYLDKDLVVRELLKTVGSVAKVKLAERLTEAEAVSLEVAFIKIIGRTPDGPLLNLTAGGEGTSGIKRVHSEATKAKIAASLTGRKNGPRPRELVDRIASAVRASLAIKPRGPRTEQTREQTRASLKLAYEEGRHPRRGGMASKRHTEETKRKMRVSALARTS